MAIYQEQDVDNAIQALSSFKSRIDELIENMISEAETCKANMEGDVVAEKASADLKNSVESVRSTANSEIDKIISALEGEKAKAQKYSQYD